MQSTSPDSLGPICLHSGFMTNFICIFSLLFTLLFQLHSHTYSNYHLAPSNLQIVFLLCYKIADLAEIIPSKMDFSLRVCKSYKC